MGASRCGPEVDSVTVDYDLHIKAGRIDSVAIQLLPERNHDLVTYETETRIKDSLYRGLSDEGECCFAPDWWWISQLAHPDLSAGAREKMLNTHACWWRYGREILHETEKWPANVPNPFSPLLWLPRSAAFIDSVLQTASIDSLRRISVPCSWQDCKPDSAYQPPSY